MLELPKHSRLAIIAPYLDHVAARAAEFERVLLDCRLFTNNASGSFDSRWSLVAFRHPSTFDTLALEPEMKKQLVEDLTTPIATMANFLRYDVYDLELSKVKDNSELRVLEI
ncbi:hypothetical protein SASPL_145676 [Salvia splendens]|uniref:Uncharacterized protein n=1 Tax=Salvia splendens TaxID=180675 RepID=A0A8X8Z8L4_SALSN|nr:hypothetical protein SASPL_145676 [Salvia splendens]